MKSSGPLRVVIINPTFGGYGGMEAFSLALLRGLPPTPELDLRLMLKPVRGATIRPELAAMLTPWAGRVRIVGRAGPGLARAVAGADVVHAMNPSPDAVLAAKALRRPLLVNVINHRLPGRTLHQRLWDFCLRRADRRFYISDFVRRTWEGPQQRAGSDVVFPLCELAGGAQPVAARRGFVFVARWIENKGVDTLVEAYAQAGLDPARWPLTLMGDGPLRTRIRERVDALGLKGVAMPGFVTQAEKTAAIRGARWMVVPPRTDEDFGLTAIEARAAGVPCIITRDGGVPEAAGSQALACAPGDVAGLAGCLRQAAEMAEDDYARRAHLTQETLADELCGPEHYARTYQELAARGKTPASAR